MNESEEIPEINLNIKSCTMEEFHQEEKNRQEEFDKIDYFDLDKWRTHHCKTLTKQGRPESQGWTSIPVLNFLWGRVYDKITLAYIFALRPQWIRVTNGLMTADSRENRITVIVDENSDTVKKITMEVRVGLPPNIVHGSALDTALQHGADSEKVKWHNDSNIESFFYDGISGTYYKILKDGTQVPYPTEED
jgi:hypothetical protein